MVVSFFGEQKRYRLKKRYKLEVDSVWGNKRDKINKGEDKRGKINKAAVLLPYWV